MTTVQQNFYSYILENKPLCDKCIFNALGYLHNQNANGHCRKLDKLNLISRMKGNCYRCNSLKLLNRVIT